MKALEIAEKRLGLEELARRLKAHPETLRAWRYGHATIPERKFLLLVDVPNDVDPLWQDPDR
jgi:hypothetical protein